MALPTFTHSLLNGRRVVAVSGSSKLPSSRTAPVAGSHDIKTVNGNTLISVNGGLYEPIDVAAQQDKL